MADFQDAVSKFPILSYLQQHNLYSVDSPNLNIYANCPVCEGKLKLGVNRDTKLMRCVRCTEGGYGKDRWKGATNLVGLICLLERCDKSHAIERIYSLSGFPDSYRARSRPQAPKEIFPKEAIPLEKADPSHPAIQFLKRRKVQHLIPHCRVCVTGYYSNRILLPAFWFKELAGFEAKSFVGAAPKSLFPTWLTTGSTLYTSLVWDKSDSTCIITESILDAETIGINALGMYGSTLREGQFQKLMYLRSGGISKLVWMLDNDAWKKQAHAILTKTNMFFENYVCPLPLGKDPNDLGHEACWERIQNAERVHDEFDVVALSAKFDQTL